MRLLRSTALRWIAALESAGMIHHDAKGKDRRRVCLTLTEAGEALVARTPQEKIEVLAGLNLPSPGGCATTPGGLSRPSR